MHLFKSTAAVNFGSSESEGGLSSESAAVSFPSGNRSHQIRFVRILEKGTCQFTGCGLCSRIRRAAVPCVSPTEAALKTYRELPARDDGQLLPLPSHTVKPGSSYEGMPRLARHLSVVGDLRGDIGQVDSYQGTRDAGVGSRKHRGRDGWRGDRANKNKPIPVLILYHTAGSWKTKKFTSLTTSTGTMRRSNAF